MEEGKGMAEKKSGTLWGAAFGGTKLSECEGLALLGRKRVVQREVTRTAVIMLHSGEVVGGLAGK